MLDHVTINNYFGCVPVVVKHHDFSVLIEVQFDNGQKITFKGDLDMSSPSPALIEMDEGFGVNLTVTPTHKGKPARYQAGSAIWPESNEFVDVIPVKGDEGNELRRRVVAKEANSAQGVTAVSCSFDADPGDGVRTITVFVNFAINVAAADTAQIQPDGPPTEEAPAQT